MQVYDPYQNVAYSVGSWNGHPEGGKWLFLGPHDAPVKKVPAGFAGVHQFDYTSVYIAERFLVSHFDTDLAYIAEVQVGGLEKQGFMLSG